MSSYPVRQFQILSKDPQRAADFYSRVFGWTINADNALAYRAITTGGIDGGIWPAPPEGHGLVQLFLEVPDVSAAAAKAADAEGSIVIPPTTLPGGDELAVIADPENIPFGLFKTRERT
jgi:predicted enzyme related to lactoylglutathione lyase